MTFSAELEKWLKSTEPKTFDRLEKVFGERSFAIVFLVFMALPALPLPTGGITHVLEALTILIAIQPILGLKKIWVPNFIRKRELPASFVNKLLPLLMRRLRWFEKYSRPRGTDILKNPWFVRLAALSILGFTLASMLAPPFSGLDTFPALGVVIISLGLLLGDIAYYIAGLLVGSAGVLLEVTVGAVLIKAIKHLWTHSSNHEKIWFISILAAIIGLLIARHIKKK